MQPLSSPLCRRGQSSPADRFGARGAGMLQPPSQEPGSGRGSVCATRPAAHSRVANETLEQRLSQLSYGSGNGIFFKTNRLSLQPPCTSQQRHVRWSLSGMVGGLENEKPHRTRTSTPPLPAAAAIPRPWNSRARAARSGDPLLSQAFSAWCDAKNQPQWTERCQ